jgi:tetratricopeptide (TPR) repeat protein
LACARQAVEIAPQSAEAHNALGGAHQSLGHQDEALRAFATAAELPGTVREEALLGVAMVLMEAGRKEEALAAFGRVLEAFPHSHRVLAARADLKTFVAGDPDIATMEALLAEGERRPIADRMGAHFALGKAYLDSGDSARAFRHFDAGNRHKRANTDYDSASAAAWLKDIADIFTAESMGRYADAGAPGDLPIFVIGMPRSGTTLVEQILSSHSQITGAGELAAFRLAVEGTGSKYPDLMRTLARDDLHRLGEDYLARTRPLAGASARLVDKMPANFIHAGLIALALPQARIVHCRRDPVDTCLSCYTKLFAGDQKFAYDQTELGEFYRAYEGLMTHWRTVLPADRFIEVDYENVVDDLETEARRLVAFTGLPWEDACLSFHENRRVVRTASVNQVRQPIYRTSKGRWRKYADHLGPLLAALGIAP